MRQSFLVLPLLALSLSFVSAATVTGKVVDSAGKPIKGANVHFTLYQEQVPMELISDAAGNFAFTEDLSYQPPHTELAQVTVYAPGYTLAQAMLMESGNVITLNAGTSINGSVVDSGGKPLAGVPVRLCWTGNNNDGASVPDEWRKRFSATTTDDGAWTLPGVPMNGTAALVLDDDRFVHEEQDITLVAGACAGAVKFTACPGATVTGRVLAPDGTPAYARVIIDSPQKHSQATYGYGNTATDGSFRFRGLATGSYSLYVMSPKDAWLDNQLTDLALTEGKEITLPDLRTNTGVVLEGTLVDAETGTPLPHGNVTLYRGNKAGTSYYCEPTTDQFGHFRVRTAKPDQFTLLCTFPPRGYLKQRVEDAQTVELQTGKTINVTLKLHKGLSLAGTVTDEEGKSATGVTLYINMPGGVNGAAGRNDTQVLCTTDQQGHFEALGLPIGKGTLGLFREYGKIAEWAQPMPVAITVPSSDAITLHMTRLGMLGVRGRVLDTQQHPLAGVIATFHVADNPPRTLTAVTGVDGGYQLEKIPAGVQVYLLTLEKAGYRQCLSGTLTNGGSKSIDDVVMAACTATVHGKVCDADGNPVLGASVVSVEGGLATRAVTDDAGVFTLSAQPAGELHLVAATRTGGGERVSAGTDVVITCTPGTIITPVDLPLALQLLDADSQLPKEQRNFNRAETLHEIADVDLALACKLAATGAEPLADGLRAYLLSKSAEKDPAKVELAQLNLLQDAECKLYAAVEIGITVVQTNPGLAEQLYQIAKPIYERAVQGNRHSRREIEGLGTFENIALRIIVLAEMLHKTDELNAMLAQLNTQIKNRSMGSYMILRPLFEAAGRVSPEFVFNVYHSIDAPYKSQYLGEAVTSMAPRDPVAARLLFNMIVDREPDGLNNIRIAPLVKALGRQDPAAALALAKTQPNVGELVAGQLEAAAFQPKAAAKSIVLDIFSTGVHQTIENLTTVNAFDPDMAKELYTNYQQALEAESRQSSLYSEDGSTSRGRVNYAYLISGIDPVEARLILETEYTSALNKIKPGAPRDALRFFPSAMCALDLARARQMLEEINVNTRFQQPLGQQLIHFILMSREERARASFY